MDTATGVYVHFPWCVRKCPYCDFATRAADPGDLPHTAYADAVLRELERRAPGIRPRHLRSIYFGGGTPSLWSAGQMERVIRAIRDAFATEDAPLEITAECNPFELDRARAAALREAGINRVSIGVQSLDDAQLEYLGRRHDAERARQALDAAVAEIPRVSADVMFGLPGQSTEALATHIDRLVDTGIAHVSAYALTIEPQTRFGELHRRGRLPIAAEDDYVESYRTVQWRMSEAGFTHYEVSNYARPGEEARHNQHYWRSGAYLGLGAAAVGCLDTRPGVARRWRNDPDPARYMAHAARGELEIEQESLGPQEIVREGLMLGLRTREGTDLDELAHRADTDPLAERKEALRRRQAAGDVVLQQGCLRVPPSRWLQLDAIVADLF